MSQVLYTVRASLNIIHFAVELKHTNIRFTIVVNNLKKKKYLYLYCVKNILLFAVFTKKILHGYGRELTFRAERSNIYFLFPRVNAFGKRTDTV